MTVAGDCARGRVYETGLLESAAGGVMRPGGLELTDRALGYCSFRPGARVVDIGCGTGTSVEHLRRSLALDAIGIDASRALLERGSRRASGAPLIRGRGNDLPLLDGSVDGVLAECSLSAMPDPGRVLGEFWRVLVPEGRLAITDLYARNPAGLHHAIPASCLADSCVAGMTTREEMAGALEEQGFRVHVWEDHSPALNELLVRLVMEHGSLRPFWECQGLRPDELQRVAGAVRQARPGYFLLVAGKKTRRGGMGAHDDG